MSCWFGIFWMTRYLLPVKLLQYRRYNRFAIQYLSGFFDITRGAWISVRNSARVTYYQNLVASSKRLDPLSTIAHRGRGSWAKPLVLHYWKYSTSFILTFWNFRMYTPYLNNFVWCFKSLLLMNGHLKSINLTSLASTISGTWSNSSSCWFRNSSFLCSAVSIFGIIYTDTQSQAERTLRIFQGHWRSQSKQFREFKLAHVRDLVKFLLQNSFFHVGTQVFCQHRGASMGSQWVPILCSAVALMREYKFFQVYHMLTIELIRRFSDSPGNNRFFCGLPHFGAIVCVLTVIANGLVLMNQSCFDEADEAGNFVMQIEPKLVGTFSVKSSATTQAHSAVPELRISTCQCTSAIIYLFLTMRWNYKWGLGWKALSYSLVHRFHFELKRTAFAYAFSLMLGFTTYRTRFNVLLFTSLVIVIRFF